MKKEKGFTLIELLAVIIILAILMVIAVPKILNVIENSKKSAAESSIKLVKDAIKTQVTSGSIMDTNFTGDDDGCYTFNFDDQTSGNAKELQLKNKEKITGTIKYCNGTFSDDSLKFDGNSISKDDTNEKIICKRATILHTEICTWKYSGHYCSGSGYTENGSKGTTTITYGNETTTPNKLKSGDAFDCDVNGDGTYDSKTERFYYVTDMDDSTAVLIYYSNVRKGKPSTTAVCAYDDSNENWHGPRTAIEELPSTSEWKNVSLKNSVRAIIASDGSNQTNGKTLQSNFNYLDKAARLLTIQEVEKEKARIDPESSNYDKFNYLFENTNYSREIKGYYGYWLENPHPTVAAILYTNSYFIDFSGQNASSVDVGVRPAIEVPKSNIEY